MQQEIDYARLGLKIKEMRQKAGLTQDNLAEMVSCNTSHISNIENARSYPSLTALFTISNSLKCGIDYLIGEQYTYEKEAVSNENIDRKLARALQCCSNEKKEKILKIVEVL